jgi:hypothetical protein
LLSDPVPPVIDGAPDPAVLPAWPEVIPPWEAAATGGSILPPAAAPAEPPATVATVFFCGAQLNRLAAVSIAVAARIVQVFMTGGSLAPSVRSWILPPLSGATVDQRSLGEQEDLTCCSQPLRVARGASY